MYKHFFFSNLIAALLPVCGLVPAYAQITHTIADSLRTSYHIPEMAYAVVSADSVYEIQALGERKLGSGWKASLNDRFRLGSNTKAITGYIAATLVKEGKLKWNTKFFDLFPELKKGSRKEYKEMTLVALLSFRTQLPSYTYTWDKPVKEQFSGPAAEQQKQFMQWFLKQKPTCKDTFCFSNLGYVAAGMMMEKVSGKTYRELVSELSNSIGADFDFGQPNVKDSLQTWGHDANLIPEAPSDNYKLNWLLAAGNINATLPGYAKFAQLQLRTYHDARKGLSPDELSFLHNGIPRFAIGWFWDEDENEQRYSYNTGNPGTFLTKVYLYTGTGKAYIVFSNAQTDEAAKGIDILLEVLKERYK